MNEESFKSSRLLYMYSCLLEGELLNKSDLSKKFNVTPRSVQRDIDTLRYFLDGEKKGRQIVYDARQKGYRIIEKSEKLLSNSEVFAVCKILLESRSMIRSEMEPILDKLVACCTPSSSRRDVQDLLANEKYHYIEPHHGTEVLPLIWQLGSAIKSCKEIDISYRRLKGQKEVFRRVLPVGIMFSEYYFYLVAYIKNIDKEEHFENPDDNFPTIYRVDRITDVSVSDDHFSIPYRDRFEEGEFRKRVQFMYGGRLQTVKFKYCGPSVEAVLDRLPSANIVEKQSDGWIISAEVFGNGIEMWLRSQGEYIEAVQESNSTIV